MAEIKTMTLLDEDENRVIRTDEFDTFSPTWEVVGTFKEVPGGYMVYPTDKRPRWQRWLWTLLRWARYAPPTPYFLVAVPIYPFEML